MLRHGSLPWWILRPICLCKLKTKEASWSRSRRVGHLPDKVLFFSYYEGGVKNIKSDIFKFVGQMNHVSALIIRTVFGIKIRLFIFWVNLRKCELQKMYIFAKNETEAKARSKWPSGELKYMTCKYSEVVFRCAGISTIYFVHSLIELLWG